MDHKKNSIGSNNAQIYWQIATLRSDKIQPFFNIVFHQLESSIDLHEYTSSIKDTNGNHKSCELPIISLTIEDRLE